MFQAKKSGLLKKTLNMTCKKLLIYSLHKLSCLQDYLKTQKRQKHQKVLHIFLLITTPMSTSTLEVTISQKKKILIYVAKQFEHINNISQSIQLVPKSLGKRLCWRHILELPRYL